MPKIILHLDDAQMKRCKEILAHNGMLDLENETFGSTDFEFSHTAMGDFLLAKGCEKEFLGHIFVEYLDDQGNKYK